MIDLSKTHFIKKNDQNVKKKKKKKTTRRISGRKSETLKSFSFFSEYESFTKTMYGAIK